MATALAESTLHGVRFLKAVLIAASRHGPVSCLPFVHYRFSTNAIDSLTEVETQAKRFLGFRVVFFELKIYRPRGPI